MVTAVAEGAVRENLFDNEEPGGGTGRLLGRGSAARGTYLQHLCREERSTEHDTLWRA